MFDRGYRCLLVVMLILGACLTVGASVPSAAQDKNISELKSILETEVTAMGRKESAKKSAAILSVVTSDDIDKMNPRNLNDVLETVPGVNIMETYFGYQSVTFRGVKQAHYNNKSLLLLNGHPVYESTRGSFNTSAIPIDAVKRVEVVRGPDSVNYGTNAYAGIINVITKQGADLEGGGEARARAGSFSHRGYSFVSGDQNGDFSYSLAGSLHESDGYDFVVEQDEFGQRGRPFYGSDEPGYENDFFNGVFQFEYDRLNVQAYAFEQERDKYGIIPALETTGLNRRQTEGLDLSYQFLNEDETKLKLFTWYDQSSVRNLLKEFPPSPSSTTPTTYESYDNSKFGVDLELNHDLTSDLNLLAGLVYENWEANPDEFIRAQSQTVSAPLSAFLDSFSTNEKALYTKLKYSLTEDLLLNAGTRLADNSEFESQEAYNAGVVYNATSNLTTKLLYKSAFRSPSFFEKRVNTPGVLYGLTFKESPSFGPETIDNFDALVSYNWGSKLVKANLFYLETDDLLSRRPLTSSEKTSLGEAPSSTALVYDNLSGEEIRGITVSFEQSFDNHNYSLDFTQQSGESVADGSDVQGIAEFTALAQYNYQFDPMDFHLGIKHVGDRAINSTDVDSYNLVDANVNWHYNESFTVGLKGSNLLDEDYDYPEYIRSNINSIPGGPGRAFYVTATQRF